MKKMMTAAIAAMSTLIGSAAAAEVHDILILRYGYYPNKVYVKAGDQIRFINRSPNWAHIRTKNAWDNYNWYNWSNPCQTNSYGQTAFSGSRDGWQTSWMPIGGQITVNIYSCMETELEAPMIWNYNGSYSNSNYYNSFNEGYIVFGDAPRG